MFSHTSLAAALALVLGAASASHAQSPGTCANPFPVSAGTPVGGATGNTADGSSTCSGTAAVTPAVWFRYTHGATAPRLLVLSLCGSGFDTVLSIHSGCPGNA